ncbi:TPA: transcriptional regulator, partial [Enterococcus faecium]|nr:transcriptional regulator [Enterococcus faecium]
SYIPIKDIILHFEKYDYRFHWNSDNSVIEIWIPIQD